MTKLIDTLPAIENQLQNYLEAKSRVLRVSFTKDSEPLNVELSDIGSKDVDEKENRNPQYDIVVKLINLANTLSYQGSNKLFKMCQDLLSTEEVKPILKKNNLKIPEQNYVANMATKTVDKVKSDLNKKNVATAVLRTIDGIADSTIESMMRPGMALDRMVDKETPVKRFQQANQLQSIINLMKRDFNQSLVPEGNKKKL